LLMEVLGAMVTMLALHRVRETSPADAPDGPAALKEARG